MILPVLCAYKVSAPSTETSGIGTADLDDLIGAVKERRIEGGETAFSGVEGAEASAIVAGSVEQIPEVFDACGSRHAGEEFYTFSAAIHEE